MQLSIHGAAQRTTGSCHLLRSGGTNVLIDCGGYQEGKTSDELNRQDFGFDPREIDYVLGTHKHYDHCAREPLLVQKGFNGQFITVEPGVDLDELVLMDSADIQEKRAEKRQRMDRQAGIFKEDEYYRSQILYDKWDVHRTLAYYGKPAKYNTPIELSDSIRVTFRDAGHILGSAFLEFELDEPGRNKKIIFSGDLGNLNRPIVNDPASPTRADYVVEETTYGDRNHKNIQDSILELYGVITDTFNRNGNVYIPCFSIERSPEILFFLRKGIEDGFLPKDIKIFLDSPMAIKAIEIYKKYPQYFDSEIKTYTSAGLDPFLFPNVTLAGTKEESKKINDIKSGAVILSASGMGEGGRVVHHIARNISKPEHSFVIVSFAAKGTISRKLIDGEQFINLFDKDIPVRAQVHTINGFSAHADQTGLLKWHRQTGKPDSTFLTHGELPAMNAMAELLRARGCHVEIPELHQEFNL